MKVPLYKEALKEGWRVAWEYKLLWIFGLFAAFLGQMGVMEILANITFTTSATSVTPRWFFIPRLIDTVFSLSVSSTEWWAWFIWVLVVIAGFGLLFLFLSVVSQGALIAAAADADWSKKHPHITRSWRTGVDHFWRLLLLNVIKKIVVVFLAFLVGQAALRVIFFQTVRGGDMALFFFVFLLAAVAGMAVSFLTIYAAGYIVVEEYRTLAAIRAAWRLFCGHWLVSLEVGAILLLATFGMVAVAFLAMFLFLVTTEVWQVLSIITGQFMLFNFVFVLGFFTALLFLIALGSIFTVFTTTVWTHLFMKMHRHGLVSKILHWMK